MTQQQIKKIQAQDTEIAQLRVDLARSRVDIICELDAKLTDILRECGAVDGTDDWSKGYDEGVSAVETQINKMMAEMYSQL